MINCYIFYKVQNYFVVIKKPSNSLLVQVDGESCSLHHEDEIRGLQNKFYYPNQLKNTNFDFSESIGHQSGLIYRKEHYLVFVPCSILTLPYHWLLKSHRMLKAEILIKEFRLQSRITLIRKITDNDLSLEGYIQAFKSYCFLDGYSFWLYDGLTKVFTHQFGSCPPTKTWIKVEENSSLNEVLIDNFSEVNRSVEDSDFVSYKLDGMRSVVRLKLDLGTNEIGVLSFYSKYSDFYIQAPALKYVREIIQMKSLHDLQGVTHAMENLTSGLLDLDFENIQSYADSVTRLICENLEYEAASLFLLDSINMNRLVCISSYNAIFKGRPKKPVYYDLGIKSHTLNVFNDTENRSMIVYDLENDGNSHIFDEPTSLGGKNWTAVPIMDKGNKVGVLRLKDKYKTLAGQRLERTPRPIDHHNIKTVANLINNHISAALKLKELNKKIETQNNFTKVFHHEFSAPLNSMNYAIDNLKFLEKQIPDEEQREQYILKLGDLEASVNRLAFIESTFNIDDLIKNESENISVIGLLSEVILPVTKNLGRYYKDYYGADIVLDHSSMRGVMVKGNVPLLQMVITSLIDNGSKYLLEDSSKLVKISAKKIDTGLITLIISSDSSEIKESEVELIFDKDGRGISALESKKHGSGIGLWLSKKIMLRLNGNIKLVSLYKPVIFELEIPEGV